MLVHDAEKQRPGHLQQPSPRDIYCNVAGPKERDQKSFSQKSLIPTSQIS